MTWISVIDARPGVPASLPVPGAWLSGRRPLLPGRTGELLLDDGTRTPCDAVPADDQLDAILAMGAAIPESATWLELLECDPLAPVSTADLDEHPLEGEIRANLAALRDVFRRPRTHLELRTARVPTGQARRLAPDALDWLAGHTEDWAHLTLRGVHPRRVLAEVRDVRWDLYENRVAVRLVDHLLGWLQKRINRLGAWLRRFDDLEELQKSAGIDGSWRRKERVFRLWKDTALEQNRRRQAQQRLRRLLALRRVLDGLRDMPLYSAIPRRASVPDVLRPSNVLQHDANYRKVAALWRAWARHERTEKLDGERYLDRQADVARAWRRFAILLVHRALDQLGYEPLEGDPRLVDGATIALDGCTLDLRDAACVQLHVPDGPSLRLVPVLADLVHARNRDDVWEAAAARGTPDTVVLHLSTAREIPVGVPELVRLAHERAGTRLGLTPVSPWDIGSTERVARALRWALLAPRIRAWPPVAKAHASLPASPWLRREGAECHVLRRPRPNEFDLAGMEKAAVALEERLAAVESEREEVKLLASRSKDDHRARNDLNERGKRLNEQRQKLAADAADLRSSYDSLQRAFATLEALAVCPVCMATGRREAAPLQPRGAGTFVCACACGAEWGTVACADGHRVPFLRTVAPGRLAEAVATATGADWLDRTLGQDVLAVPHLGEPGRLVCMTCGKGVG